MTLPKGRNKKPRLVRGFFYPDTGATAGFRPLFFTEHLHEDASAALSVLDDEAVGPFDE